MFKSESIHATTSPLAASTPSASAEGEPAPSHPPDEPDPRVLSPPSLHFPPGPVGRVVIDHDQLHLPEVS